MCKGMAENEIRLDDLFKRLVPFEGKADTVAGEIVRAVSQICYRYYNDGDRLGIGYGRETCNPAGRYLALKCGGDVRELIWDMWGSLIYEYSYQLHDLIPKVLEYLDDHLELEHTENLEDMWSYKDKKEDIDRDDDGEEEYW